jgi:hypothetical protein
VKSYGLLVLQGITALLSSEITLTDIFLWGFIKNDAYQPQLQTWVTIHCDFHRTVLKMHLNSMSWNWGNMSHNQPKLFSIKSKWQDRLAATLRVHCTTICTMGNYLSSPTPHLLIHWPPLLLLILFVMYVEWVFLIMNCYWRNGCHKSNMNLIKSEIAVKMNYKYPCKDFYTSVLKEKISLMQQSQTKKYDLNWNNKPKLINWKFLFLINHKMQQHISLW